MIAHDKRVLTFLLSHESTQMSRRDVARRVQQMKHEDWQEHAKRVRPDGSCRGGCPLHS